MPCLHQRFVSHLLPLRPCGVQGSFGARWQVPHPKNHHTSNTWLQGMFGNLTWHKNVDTCFWQKLHCFMFLWSPGWLKSGLPKKCRRLKAVWNLVKRMPAFSEKFHLCFRGWQDVDGKSTPFYNDLNLQKKAPELCRGIGADGFSKSTNEFSCQHESDRICTARIILRWHPMGSLRMSYDVLCITKEISLPMVRFHVPERYDPQQADN